MRGQQQGGRRLLPRSRAALTLQGWGARRVAGHPCHRQKIGVTGGAIPLSGGAGKRRRTRGVDRVPRSWCP